LSGLLAEKLSPRDLRLLQQYRHKADNRGTATICPLLDKSGQRTGIAAATEAPRGKRLDAVGAHVGEGHGN